MFDSSDVIKIINDPAPDEKPEQILSDAAVFKTVEPSKSFTKLPAMSKTKNIEIHRPVSIDSANSTNASYVNYSAPDVRLAEGNTLHLAAWKKQADDKTIIRNAETYVVRTNGTYQKTKNGTDLIISNSFIEIEGFEHFYTLDEKNNYAPLCTEIIKGFAHLNNGKKYPWEIPLSKYKQLFTELTKKHGDITFSTKAGDSIDHCLSDLYTDALDKHKPVTITVDFSGWYELEGHPAAYLIGKKNTTSKLADVSSLNRRDIMRSGLNFLSIGRNKHEIAIIFLFMHAGFTNFWMKKGGIGWNMCLVLQGQTNAGKTSVLEVSVDVLNDNRKSGLIKLGDSTEAGARRVLNTIFRDTFCCFDDFSNADEKTSRNAHNLVETALRLIGDEAGRVRAGAGMEVIREQANCVLAATAEEDFQFSASSYSRYLRVLLKRPVKSSETGAVVSNGTLDFSALSYFKDHPEILRTYHSLYISFLTEKGYEIVDYIRRQTPIYRQSFNSFQIGRLVDAGVRLKLQADIIGQFAMWCGFAEAEAKAWVDLLDSAIAPTVKAQEELFEESTPAQVFLNALVNCFDFGKQLAATEDEYVYSAGLYVGFIDSTEGTYWLNKEIVNAAVQAYIRDEGINFRTPMKNIPKLLYAEGYAKATVKMKNGKVHYTFLPRSKKGTSSQRKGMYVIYISKLKKFYEED